MGVKRDRNNYEALSKALTKEMKKNSICKETTEVESDCRFRIQHRLDRQSVTTTDERKLSLPLYLRRVLYRLFLPL